MFRSIVALIAAFCLMSCGDDKWISASELIPKPEVPAFSGGSWSLPRRPIKVMSWNVEFGKGLDEALEIVAAENPDVICLQEIRMEQIDGIKRRLRMDGCWYPSSNLEADPRGYTRQSWGNAVFTQGRLTQAQSMPNPNAGSFGVWAVVDLAEGRFIVGSVHLMHAKSANLGVPQRTAEARQLVQDIKRVQAPVLIGGDVNAPPQSLTHQILTDCLVDLSKSSGATLPSRFPLVRVDYVLGTKEWKSIEARVLDSRVSDHRPVVAELTR